MFQIGLPPARIDILSDITGVSFDDAWSRRLGPKDIADMAMLEGAGRPSD